MSNIGLMEGAFFVGRKEIVDWINATLDINITKVEDTGIQVDYIINYINNYALYCILYSYHYTASGAIACQLLDMIYPGQVPMSKINWAAKQSFEFVGNYKVLQTCFTKLLIDKFIDVDRLISGKYMDNLEFMQWFKRFFELTLSEPRGTVYYII
jgi:RP/EB family microtubule-associated protein